MVFYRKYRPQTLDEIIGQNSVKQGLKLALSAGKLAHAYLLCGPRGTGKTSTARILAKIVNCESRESRVKSQDVDLPCNKCASCISITDGSNLDVVEIDAASNRGIDDVRALRENIKLSPTTSLKKVYIIDEVHMLSTDAFNALLKTLEEPPEHALFILATTEVQKIPQTILSRVQKLDFKLASIEELIEDLENIAKSEKLDIDKDAILSLAKKAGGSFRDGEKLLDQLSSLKKVDQGAVDSFFNLGNFDSSYELLMSISGHKTSDALKKLIIQFDAGISAKELTVSILDLLRQLLFVKNNLGDTVVKPELGDDKYQKLEELAKKFTEDQLIYVANCFQKSLEQARFVSISTLPLEIAVVESCRPVDQYIGKSENQSVSESEGQQVSKPEPVADILTRRNTETPKHRNTETQGSDIEKIQAKWAYILETVRAYNFSLEALLRSSKLFKCEGNSVLFEVPYSFHQRILEAPKSKDLLESILADILGRVVKVSTILGSKPVRSEEIANIEIAADDEIVRLASEIFNSETIN